MVEVKSNKCVQTLSLGKYNEKELKNQSIKNIQILVKIIGKKPNDIFNLLKRLIV